MFCIMLKMSQIKTSKWLFREITKTSKCLFAPKNALFYLYKYIFLVEVRRV